MSTPLHASRPAAAHSPVQLMLKTPAGARWALTLSQGMERFIGHYPRVAGLGSGGPLLRYERIRPPGNG
jgi:Protein of unknown function (DUF5818)